ncbi:unnamed protein product, partial [Iphiclides podalirius]
MSWQRKDRVPGLSEPSPWLQSPAHGIGKTSCQPACCLLQRGLGLLTDSKQLIQGFSLNFATEVPRLSERPFCRFCGDDDSGTGRAQSRKHRFLG